MAQKKVSSPHHISLTIASYTYGHQHKLAADPSGWTVASPISWHAADMLDSRVGDGAVNLCYNVHVKTGTFVSSAARHRNTDCEALHTESFASVGGQSLRAARASGCSWWHVNACLHGNVRVFVVFVTVYMRADLRSLSFPPTVPA